MTTDANREEPVPGDIQLPDDDPTTADEASTPDVPVPDGTTSESTEDAAVQEAAESNEQNKGADPSDVATNSDESVSSDTEGEVPPRQSFVSKLKSLGAQVNLRRLGVIVGALTLLGIAVWFLTSPDDTLEPELALSPSVQFLQQVDQVLAGELTRIHTADFVVDDEILQQLPTEQLIEFAAERARETVELAAEKDREALSSAAARQASVDAPEDASRSAASAYESRVKSPLVDTVLIDEGVVTDQGMGLLAKIPDLQHLRLRLSPITDQGLEPLLGSETLWYLNLPHSEITADGIRSLAQLPKLRQLRLGSPNLGNEACRAFAELKSLRGLHLIGIPVTDEGLKLLAELPHLESLYLDDTAVTDVGWNWLFRNHPQLHVHINQKHHDRDPKAHSHD